jgi:very-short-patch-repair endonuclease/Mn-dependent DtxR family transcriptional regulator
MRSYTFTDEQVKRIKHVYSTGEVSLSELAREFGLPSRTPIKTFAKKLGLNKPTTRNSNSGIKIYWSTEMDNKLMEGYSSPYNTVAEIAGELGVSEDTATKRARQLGLKKSRKIKITEEQVSLIKELAKKDVKMKDLENITGLCDETIRKQLRALNIDSKLQFVNDLDNKENFFKDLGNPRYSAPDLSRKYGVSNSTIHHWRKRIFGEFKLQLNTTQHLSDLEVKMSEILDELDLVYLPQKKIRKWVVDFYLGQKTIIEVDGEFHDTSKVIEKDKRKLEDLSSNGYKVITVHHSEFSNIPNIKLRISKILGLPIV